MIGALRICEDFFLFRPLSACVMYVFGNAFTLVDMCVLMAPNSRGVMLLCVCVCLCLNNHMHDGKQVSIAFIFVTRIAYDCVQCTSLAPHPLPASSILSILWIIYRILFRCIHSQCLSLSRSFLIPISCSSQARHSNGCERQFSKRSLTHTHTCASMCIWWDDGDGVNGRAPLNHSPFIVHSSYEKLIF